jgi:predicted transcriptional regulator
MINVKSKAIALINGMPNDSTIEDIMEELYFKSQVDAGLKQLEEGDFVTHDEVKLRVSKV